MVLNRSVSFVALSLGTVRPHDADILITWPWSLSLFMSSFDTRGLSFLFAALIQTATVFICTSTEGGIMFDSISTQFVFSCSFGSHWKARRVQSANNLSKAELSVAVHRGLICHMLPLSKCAFLQFAGGVWCLIVVGPFLGLSFPIPLLGPSIVCDVHLVIGGNGCGYG